ncbi:type II toxin-antitoxin system prevent-host-death family antitoxin [Kiloniella sp.]|uniref:type II toxin-antitoxin system prevent-host-death family antitoxin n=1 Tax=Kiloniella sp. TaxID=1938587 RepID=UPI003B016E56
MKEFSAADVTRSSGDLFAAAAAEPVAITKHSKPRFVVMTIEKFKKMSAQGDQRKAYSLNELPDDLAFELMDRLEVDLDD